MGAKLCSSLNGIWEWVGAEQERNPRTAPDSRGCEFKTARSSSHAAQRQRRLLSAIFASRIIQHTGNVCNSNKLLRFDLRQTPYRVAELREATAP